MFERLDINAPDHRLLQSCDYAILNPLQLAADTYSDLPQIPLVPEGYEAQAAVFPKLILLNELEQRERAALLDRMVMWEKTSPTPWFSALLTAPINSQRMSRQLCRLMVLRMPDGGKALLRFFDPRVCRHFLWLLSDLQKKQWLGDVTHWYWRTPDNHWHCLERGEPVFPRLRFNKQQLATLERLADINQLMDRLIMVAPASLGEPDIAKRIDQLLVSAKEQGLSRQGDRQLLVEQIVIYGAEILQHDKLRNSLECALAGEGSYERLCSDFDDKDLRHMVDDVRHQKELT